MSLCLFRVFFFFFFFFNDTATTEIYTLSLHDALPIFNAKSICHARSLATLDDNLARADQIADRKSTRLNSSHQIISYAVFCLKKKKNNPRRKKASKNSPPMTCHD